jgi:hypothetical protein
MLRGIQFKPLLALNRAFYLPWWNGALFHDSVSHNSSNGAVEKIENSVVDAL